MNSTVSLNPRFDVVPHGVAIEQNEVYAVFKMIMSFPQSDNPVNVKAADMYEMWKACMQTVNQKPWRYRFESTKHELHIHHNAQKDSAIRFHVPGRSGLQENPHFGRGPGGDEGFDPWENVLGTRNFTMQIPGGDDAPLVRQFDLPKPGEALSDKAEAGMETDPFKPALDASSQYYGGIFNKTLRAQQSQDPSKYEYNFNIVYGSVLDEPIAAEYGFGVVREFTIPMDQLIPADGEIKYQIKVNDTDAPVPYLLIKDGAKYYNGIQSPFLDFNSLDAARIQLYDPYKGMLEKSNPSPDGLYCVVKYKENKPEDGIGHDGPFDQPDVKGFNVVLTVDKDARLHSICRHAKEIKFAAAAINPQNGNTAGLMIPHSDLVTSENTRVRTALLFAWRGDHLLVNRVRKEKPDEEESTFSEGNAANEYCLENNLVNEHMFTRTDTLLPSSQPQLITSLSYNFYIRMMGLSEYCIPLERELLGPEAARMLTAEDFIRRKDWKPLAYHPEQAPEYPIKQPIFHENKPDANPKLTDKEYHVILNKLASQRRQSRYILPPRIKMEDFRQLGFLTKEKICGNHTDDCLETFVARCLVLDRRIDQSIPRVVADTYTVTYLADPRANGILVCPDDLFTLNMQPALPVQALNAGENYPYNDRLTPVKLTIYTQQGKNFISFNNGAPASKNLPDGIYSFKAYAVDRNLKPDLSNLDKYNAVPFKISLQNKPPAPRLNVEKLPATGKMEATRLTIPPFLQYWQLNIPVKNANPAWKSLKYQEETQLLQLQRTVTPQMQKAYNKAGYPKFELLHTEQPYEMFLGTEGSLDNEQLCTDLYPAPVTIKCRFSKIEELNGNSIFKIRLNESQLLDIRAHDNHCYFHLADPGLMNGQSLADDFDIELFFDLTDGRFKIKAADILHTLAQPLHPEFSVNDLDLSPEAMMWLLKNPNRKIEVDNPASYTFVSDLKLPYSRTKTIRLFASSVFQPYFPDSRSEFGIGSRGDTFQVFIPNNIKPTAPVVEPELLLVYRNDPSWRNLPGGAQQQQVTEQVVRLNLPGDFMTEGKNKLGIVLSESSGKPENRKYISEIGEDITKLTASGLQSASLKAHLQLDHPNSVLSKYLDQTGIRYYNVSGVIYEVLETIPFYNMETGRWQVILPFRIPVEVETVFIKFVTLKIAPGHGKSGNGTVDSPFLDETGTVLSDFSEAAHIPIYNRKTIQLKKYAKTYEISTGQPSQHSGKVFFVMLLKALAPSQVLIGNNPSAFPDLAPFDYTSAKGNKETGHILMFTGNETITISKAACQKVLVLEFEKHDNYQEIEGKPGINSADVPRFVEIHPLFESKGLRLVNSAEFTV